jgi:hypothetical protein
VRQKTVAPDALPERVIMFPKVYADARKNSVILITNGNLDQRFELGQSHKEEQSRFFFITDCFPS